MTSDRSTSRPEIPLRASVHAASAASKALQATASMFGEQRAAKTGHSAVKATFGGLLVMSLKAKCRLKGMSRLAPLSDKPAKDRYCLAIWNFVIYSFLCFLETSCLEILAF